MTQLFVTLFSSVGAAGLGSGLKIFGGFIQSLMESRNIAAKEKMALILQSRKADNAFQKSVFGGNSADSASALVTRRILAVIGMCTLSAMGLIAISYPGEALYTFTPADVKGNISLFWGFVNFPQSADLVSTVTLGHLAISVLTTLSMIVGFYFTPGGRK
jgi:hypothetical protein